MCSQETPPPQKESPESKKRNYQNKNLSPVSLMMYLFVEFARNLALMIANLPSSPYREDNRFRKLAALSRQAGRQAADWIIEFGAHSLVSFITPAWIFIEKIINVIKACTVYLGDIQFGERYEQSIASSKITRLEDKKAKFDGENHHETALTNELETTLLILRRSKQLDSALDALIQMLQNYMIDLQNSVMYAILHALVSELEHGTLPNWRLFNIINNTKREVDRREIVSAAQKRQRISATENSETMSAAENLHFDECQ